MSPTRDQPPSGNGQDVSPPRPALQVFAYAAQHLAGVIEHNYPLKGRPWARAALAAQNREEVERPVDEAMAALRLHLWERIGFGPAKAKPTDPPAAKNLLDTVRAVLGHYGCTLTPAAPSNYPQDRTYPGDWRKATWDWPHIPEIPATLLDDLRAAARALLPAPEAEPVVEIEGDRKPSVSRPAPKEPSKDAMTVYRYWFASGTMLSDRKTQTQLAEDPTLMELLGRKVEQGTISRYLKQVREWIRAGNILPSLSDPSESKPTPMDPERIDLGIRVDRRKHQSNRHKSNRED